MQSMTHTLEIPPPAALSVRNISKTFAGQRALDDVSFDVPAGKITALLGMNGSGKSTLIKILAGIYTPDPGGTLSIRGRDLRLPLTPAQAHDTAGLRFLHQDIGLVDSLTVADNFALVDRFFASGPLGRINLRRQHEHVAATLALLDIDQDPGALVGSLSPSARTMIGIARAFQDRDRGIEALRQNILVLDEPTASLPADEVDKVLGILEKLRDNGGTAVYVSHRIDEVRRIADQLVVLRDGQMVAEESLGTKLGSDIVSLVIGRELQTRQDKTLKSSTGAVVLSATNLHGNRLAGVNLHVRAGEILGITGLIGCGRSELIRILAGAQHRRDGEMELSGTPYSPHDPASAVAAGVTCVPQDRRKDGCVLEMTVGENLTLGRLHHYTTNGAIDRRREQADATQLAKDYLVKAAGLQMPIRALSGGNQQKVVVARAASGNVKVLLLDEPSQGVDAAAKHEISQLLRTLAASGVAIIIASTDHDDFIDLAHRVVVLDRGREVAALEGSEITGDRLALACTTSAHAN
jgi:ribose transport system ATP-binding protein